MRLLPGAPSPGAVPYRLNFASYWFCSTLGSGDSESSLKKFHQKLHEVLETQPRTEMVHLASHPKICNNCELVSECFQNLVHTSSAGMAGSTEKQSDRDLDKSSIYFHKGYGYTKYLSSIHAS